MFFYYKCSSILDGWGETYYVPGDTTILVNISREYYIPINASHPVSINITERYMTIKELNEIIPLDMGSVPEAREIAIGMKSYGVCSKERYYVKEKSEFVETNEKDFSDLLEKYNASCKDCLVEIEYGF